MKFGRSRFAVISIVLLIALLPQHADAAKKRKSSRRARAAATPVDKATGATLEERLGSLINGTVARASEASIEVVEIANGRVVAEHEPHQPLAPASNMKLFTTAAAIDLMKPTFEITTNVYVRGNIEPS